MEPRIEACVGSHKIRFGKWYTPNDKQPAECTYCEWCIRNGCIDVLETYLVEGVEGQANCDCPNQSTHEKIKSYVCEKCQKKGGVMNCALGRCKMPGCRGYTSSMGKPYCKGCSAIFHKCEYCGEENLGG